MISIRQSHDALPITGMGVWASARPSIRMQYQLPSSSSQYPDGRRRIGLGQCWQTARSAGGLLGFSGVMQPVLVHGQVLLVLPVRQHLQPAGADAERVFEVAQGLEGGLAVP